MSFACGWVRERLVAVPAAERLLACVDAHVPFIIASVGKLLPTILQKQSRPWRIEIRWKWFAHKLNPGEVCKVMQSTAKVVEVYGKKKQLSILKIRQIDIKLRVKGILRA